MMKKTLLTSLALILAATAAVAASLSAKVEKLKTNPGNWPLRKDIIETARKMDPPPALPKKARRHMARARAAIKAAQTSADYLDAVNEYYLALGEAPWHPGLYYNVGIVLDKADKYQDAINNLNAYLIASPEAPDREKVQELIFEIEYRRDKAAKKTSAPAAVSYDHLAGEWMMKGDEAAKVKVEVAGNTFRLSKYEHYYQPRDEYRWDLQLRGTFAGKKITGVHISNDRACPRMTSPMTGVVSDDGGRMEFEIPKAVCGHYPDCRPFKHCDYELDYRKVR